MRVVPKYLGAGKLQGLTGAEAQPQVITMFFLIFCFNLRFSDSLDSGEMLLAGRLVGSSLGLILRQRTIMDFL